ncbi:serine hydrolase [Paenibacillus hubeiensis]|uniref:serine hydrolase n=1 Tax=Paenibacillus hubeiensis TaxID=3077330 RepID=UPI0031BB5C10
MSIATNSTLLDGLDEYIIQQLQEWKTAGLALAVIHNDEIIWKKGYGYRDVESKSEVTPETLFAIGSSTKAFTAATAAQLVDQELLKWDTPVKTYMEEFQMFDTMAAERMTIRDMLCHRSGLPRHEMAWYNSGRTREELIYALRYLEPNEDFRNKWQYQNLIYMAAGYLVGHIKETEWEQFAQQYLLDPLGMASSVFSVQDMQQKEDYAYPYIEKDGKLERMPFRNIDAIGPAGSINSNLSDMIAWLRFQLNQGQFDGQSLISKEQFAVMHTPHMPCDSPFQGTEMPVCTYGLGWFIEPYRGHMMIHHGGAIDGFASQVAFLPEQNIGIVALSNTQGSVVPYTASFRVVDLLLQLDVVDWSGKMRKIMGGEPAEQDTDAIAPSAITSTSKEPEQTDKEETPTSFTLERHGSAYEGVYVNPGYGELFVRRREDGLETYFNQLEMPMTYSGNETFSVELPLLGLTVTATFEVSEDGHVQSVSIPLLMEPGTKPIVFVKQPKQS